jgi:hypothetical protein
MKFEGRNLSKKSMSLRVEICEVKKDNLNLLRFVYAKINMNEKHPQFHNGLDHSGIETQRLVKIQTYQKSPMIILLNNQHFYSFFSLFLTIQPSHSTKPTSASLIYKQHLNFYFIIKKILTNEQSCQQYSQTRHLLQGHIQASPHQLEGQT